MAPIGSHYKRLHRFFRCYELNYTEMAQTVVTLMEIPEPWILSVVHEGVAFPLVWCLLNKQGNSNRDERIITLFNQFLERFGVREIACLTADREFVGKDWFGYL